MPPFLSLLKISSLCLGLLMFSAEAKKCISEIKKVSEQRSERFWKHQRKIHKKEAKRVLTAERNLYLALKNRNDPFVAFLEKLGFQFSNPVKVPPDPATILKELDERYFAIKNKGLLSLRMADWIDVNHGTTQVFPFGSTLEFHEGFEPQIASSSTNTHFSKLLSQESFPAGDYGVQILGRRTTNFIHNLGHMMTIQDNPEVYDRMIRRIQDLRNRRDSGDISKATFRVFRDRLFLLTETLVVIKDENQNAIRKLMDLPNPNPQYTEIRAHLMNLDNDALIKLAKRLDSQVPLYITRIGGGLVEPTTIDSALKVKSERLKDVDPMTLGNPNSADEYQQAYNLVNQFTNFDDVWLRLKFRLKELKPNTEYFDRAKMLDALAAFQYRMLNLFDLKAEDWIDELLSDPRIPNDSKISRYFGSRSAITGHTTPYFDRMFLPHAEDYAGHSELEIAILSGTKINKSRYEVLTTVDQIEGTYDHPFHLRVGNNLGVKSPGQEFTIHSRHWNEIIQMLDEQNPHTLRQYLVFLSGESIAANPALSPSHVRQDALLWPQDKSKLIFVKLMSVMRTQTDPQLVARAAESILAQFTDGSHGLTQDQIKSFFKAAEALSSSSNASLKKIGRDILNNKNP